METATMTVETIAQRLANIRIAEQELLNLRYKFTAEIPLLKWVDIVSVTGEMSERDFAYIKGAYDGLV